jgi:ABC-2 type transport system permease protein
MWAIVERDVRKFLRSPALMVASLIFPLVQLIVLGNAFGGKIKDARLAIVDQDCGAPTELSAHVCGEPDIEVREALNAIHVNARTISTVFYTDEAKAVRDVRNGAIIIPQNFSRDVYLQKHPRLGLVLDNTDNFMEGTLQPLLAQLVDSLNQPSVPSRLPQQIALEVVELYPYIEYMKYLLPGSIALAMFVSVMIGGGIVYIDDKARGVHEGYLVTPITKLELVLGLNLAGAMKAAAAGIVISFVGSLLAGLSVTFHPNVFFLVVLMILATSCAFIAMMSCLMARIDDPLVPRAIFGILNTLLFFPSGAIYPIQAFPKWLQAIAYIDPFSYAVHGFKALLLRDAGFAAIWGDLLYLSVFAVVMFTGATLLFKRTL